MNKMTNALKRVRTVKVNEQGQLVIPEDLRKDLGIKGSTTLVIIEQNGELLLKKESEVLEAIENKFWEALIYEAMRKAWGKEDEIWDKIAKESPRS